MINATRSEATKADYTNRAIRLCRKAYLEACEQKVDVSKHTKKYSRGGRDVIGLSLIATAKWASSRWADNLLGSTWRYYRSALLYFSEVEFKSGGIQSSIVVDKINELLKSQSIKNSKKRGNTSSLKKKSLSESDLEEILKSLRESRSQVAGFLSVWIYVNSLVGLRPIEWATCEVVDRDGVNLKVINAKRTNGRAHGEFRYVSLTSFSKNQTNRIISFAQACGELNKAGVYNGKYESCRKLLQRTCRKIWPSRKQHVTLYTTRHQFSADLKKSGKKLEEIAYLMGHISTDTATFHYGKKRHGRSKVTPDVPNSDLKGIISKHKTFTFTRQGNKRRA